MSTGTYMDGDAKYKAQGRNVIEYKDAAALAQTKLPDRTKIRLEDLAKPEVKQMLLKKEDPYILDISGLSNPASEESKYIQDKLNKAEQTLSEIAKEAGLPGHYSILSPITRYAHFSSAYRAFRSAHAKRRALAPIDQPTTDEQFKNQAMALQDVLKQELSGIAAEIEKLTQREQQITKQLDALDTVIGVF